MPEDLKALPLGRLCVAREDEEGSEGSEGRGIYLMCRACGRQEEPGRVHVWSKKNMAA